MRIKVGVLFLILSFSAYGAEVASRYSAETQTERTSNLTPADEDDIREAVFRYQFTHNASAQQQNARVYFLSLGKGRAPSNLFMLRFKDHKPPVKQVSFLASNKDVKGKETGPQGLIFCATKIEQISEDEVEVCGGYYEGALSSSGNIYRVKRTDNRWIIIKDRMIYIS